jgi:ABC-type polysaccharide/polyol phosphate transport system ATPase subunit
MARTAIEVDHLSKNFRLYHERNQYLKATVLKGRRARYEEFWALKDVSFEIEFGRTFGIVGSNGSGKSTMLKCLAGILYPDKGSVRVNGRLTALLELGAGFHPELTGIENIYLNGAILGLPRAEIKRRFDDIVSFAGLEKFIDTPVKNYSSGMTVRLGFAIAANVDPEILLIDEVLAVGDASFQRKCAETIEQFRKEGRTIVFVGHGMDQVEQLCERAAWLERGELKAVGPTSDVVDEYMGSSHGDRLREAEQGQRWGSGEAEIRSVRLLDADGAETLVLESGRPATITIDFDAATRLDELIVGFRITHLHGLPVFGTNTRRRATTIHRVQGPGRISFAFDRFPLLEGVYDLTIDLADHSEAHAYDHWDKGVRFEVSQPGIFDEGVVVADGKWIVDELD